MFKQARARLLDEAKSMDLADHDLMARLGYPQMTLAANLSVRMDDGSLRGFKAWRCRHNDLLGPTKGGIRFHQSVSHDHVMALALWMTCKNACVGLPFGGAKGGVCVDVHQLSTHELERLARAYIRAFLDWFGGDRDIPAPDMYTGGVVMGWMADEMNVLSRRHNPSALTGKPLPMGGIEGRAEATGEGGAIVLDALHDRLQVADKARIAIQGFGSAGGVFGHAAVRAGHRIIAVSDSSGATFDEAGLDLDALAAHKKETGSVAGFASDLRSESILATDCDLLVPAALGGVIDREQAQSIEAGAVLELANGAVMPDADDVLEGRGIIAIPDILANAGGVAVSHTEWVANRKGDDPARTSVMETLETRMRRQARAVAERATDEGLSLRRAAYRQALTRLKAASDARGNECDYR